MLIGRLVQLRRGTLDCCGLELCMVTFRLGLGILDTAWKTRFLVGLVVLRRSTQDMLACRFHHAFTAMRIVSMLLSYKLCLGGTFVCRLTEYILFTESASMLMQICLLDGNCIAPLALVEKKPT
jgi:hypothetical protein